MSDPKIEIGDTARDTITGFEGLVVCTAVSMTNCDTVNLQPQGLKDDGSPKDDHGFDVPQLELVKKGVLPAKKPAALTVDLGCEVEDTMTPYKGVVDGIATWINGCVRISVKCAELHENLPIESKWLPMQQLKVVKPATTAGRPKTGGPMDSPMKMSYPTK